MKNNSKQGQNKKKTTKKQLNKKNYKETNTVDGRLFAKRATRDCPGRLLSACIYFYIILNPLSLCWMFCLCLPVNGKKIFLPVNGKKILFQVICLQHDPLL